MKIEEWPNTERLDNFFLLALFAVSTVVGADACYHTSSSINDHKGIKRPQYGQFHCNFVHFGIAMLRS